VDQPSESKWRNHGVRIVHSDELDLNTPQTPGMSRAAAITHARVGAEKLWRERCHPSKPRPALTIMARRERDLCGQRARPYALGRSARVCR